MASIDHSISPMRRWGIALAGTLLQLCLGTVYAWSFFQDLLAKGYGWTNSQVAWAFCLAICFLGLAAAVGGAQLGRFGPRRLAVLGGVLFGLGYLIAALALHQRWLWLLYVGYGVIGGSGLGLGYVTPVATVAKWFPDRKGLATGMVIMGFGFGALLMSKCVAPMLMDWSAKNLVTVFAAMGFCLGAASVLAGSFLQNPPPGFAPPGWTAPVSKGAAHETVTPGALSMIFSVRFAGMWAVFFANIMAGISLISFQSPLLQDLWRKLDAQLSPETLAACGATLIAVSSLFNGVGRMAWGAASDRIGRSNAFRLMLLTQTAAFVALAMTSHPWIFAILVCYVLLCYGGGFGTMPSFVLDVFGPGRMAVVYGTILTAWSAAGVAGPQLIAYLKDRDPSTASQTAFWIATGLLAAGAAVSLFLSNHPIERVNTRKDHS